MGISEVKQMSIEHHGNIGESETETFKLDVRDGIIHLELFMGEPEKDWDYVDFSDKVGQYAQQLLRGQISMNTKDKVILFDHVDNVLEDLALSNEEILECLPAIRERLLECQKILNENVTIEEYEQYGEG